MSPPLLPPATRSWPRASRPGPSLAEADWPRVRWPRSLALSAGVRFGIIYAGVFALSILALALFLWWSTAGLLDRQTEATINADTTGLLQRLGDGGLIALEQTIDDRLSDNIDDDAVYLLTDPAMHKLAGNLDSLPVSVLREEGFYDLKLVRFGRKSLAEVRQLPLPGGFHLVVGRDVEVHAQMTRLLTDALLWAAGVALLLGTLGALAVRGLFRITLADISATASAISAGDLTRRVRVSGRGDEFDRLAETINDMLSRIGRLMDGVRQVSNAIAHDLRTPITRARARLEDAASHAATEADLRAAIERAEADLDGVVAIFNALLRIAEIEAGARRSAFAEIDLAPLLLDLADLYGAVAEERRQVLRADIPPSVPAYGDRDMIQQAVANLLDNALKFSPEGGTIRLAAETAPGQGPRLIVEDGGPGIPEADRDRATERFFRGEAARSTPGSGLGLALVQAVATLHGGHLLLSDNQPGLRAEIRLNPRLGVARVNDSSSDPQRSVAAAAA